MFEGATPCGRLSHSLPYSSAQCLVERLVRQQKLADSQLNLLGPHISSVCFDLKSFEKSHRWVWPWVYFSNHCHLLVMENQGGPELSGWWGQVQSPKHPFFVVGTLEACRTSNVLRLLFCLIGLSRTECTYQDISAGHAEVSFSFLPRVVKGEDSEDREAFGFPYRLHLTLTC